jgi:site-specific DNA-methyltransferase (adenine-specific)
MEKIQLMQGDCLELMKGIADKSVDMILCDLPYGVTARNKWDCVIPFEKLWEQYERVVKERGAIVLTATQPFTTDLIQSNRKWFKYSLVWSKSQVTGFLNAKKQPLRSHEDILVFYQKQPTYNPKMVIGKRVLKSTGGDSTNYGKFTYKPHYSEQYYPKSIIEIPQKRFKGGHPTQKPVELMEYLVKTYTNEGETVLDNCMGSGSTGVAAVNCNRNFIGIELDKTYFNIAKERIYATARDTESN